MRQAPSKTWVFHPQTGACEYTTPKAFGSRPSTSSRCGADARLARALARALALARRVFAHASANPRARARHTIKRASRVVFKRLGFDFKRSRVARGAFEAEALAGRGGFAGFETTTRALASYISRARAFKRALEFMKDRNANAAIAVLESACGDRTIGTLVCALLESYAAVADARGALEDVLASPGSVLGEIFGSGRCVPALASAVMHQMLVGKMPTCSVGRGSWVKVEDVDVPAARVDERFVVTPISIRSEEVERNVSDEAASASESESESDSELMVIGESQASPPPPSTKLSWSAQTRALGLRTQDVVEDGNCGFRSIAHGLRVLAEANLWRFDGDGDGDDWRGVRKMMCSGLEAMRDRASESGASRLYDLLLSGNEGREYLRRGRLRHASQDERFRKYLATMRKDAAPFAATPKWTRFWCTDSEFVAIATLTRIAIVCVETAGDFNAAGRSPFFIAVPPLPHSPSPDDRLGAYRSDGAIDVADESVTWSSTKRGREFTLRRVDSALARTLLSANLHARSTEAGVFLAIVVAHEANHFRALVPRHPNAVFVVHHRVLARAK